jgi:DNA polymerase-3 subunit delta'
MSPAARSDEDDEGEVPHPRVTTALFGQRDAETAFLSAYRSGRVPHAFLIAGPKGVGKATLAYRIARFVLAHPDPAELDAATTTLAVPPDQPVARRIAAQAQPDLLVIERAFNDKGVLHKQIAVEDIRRTIGFFGSTAGEGGWRIAIVDAVDELNRSGVNALLKVLEEPPERALLLLVSHSAARVPATLRSRCRELALRPLDAADVAAALAEATGAKASEPELVAAAAAADGSVARALLFLDEGALALREQALALLDRLPSLDPKALHALGDALAGTDPQPLLAFVDTVNGWLTARLHSGDTRLEGAARLSEAWSQVNATARDAEIYNLERKPMVFNVFGLLAEATRG